VTNFGRKEILFSRVAFGANEREVIIFSAFPAPLFSLRESI